MALNQRNFGIIEGRLTKDPVYFENKDGSKKVMVTIAARDNFKGKDGQYGTQFINLEAFLRADATFDPYAMMHTGDLVGLSYSMRSNTYEKDGETIYTQVCAIDTVDLKESKAVVEQRQAAAVAAANAAAEPAAEPEV